MSKNSQNYEVVPDPILTSVFRWFGMLGIGGSICAGMLMLGAWNNGSQEFPYLKFFITLSIVAFTILCYGVAEIIYKIAQIEFSVLQGQAILESLQKIEGHLEGIRGGDEINVVIKKVKSKKGNKEEY